MDIIRNTDPEFIYSNLVRIIKNALADALNKGIIRTEVLEVPSDTNDYIILQVIYNKYYNRAFIEFELSKSMLFKYQEETDRIKRIIESYILSNLYKDTECYPELILPDDGVNERIDSTKILTPFVVGYWECLGGGYEFIYSNIEVLHDVDGINIATYNHKFYEELDKLIKQYYVSNFDLFLMKLLILYEEYDVSPDKKPDKKIEDFFIKVKELSDQYTNPILTDKQKQDYIIEYNNIVSDYHNDKDELSSHIKELNDKYLLISNLNSKIPEIFNKYKEIYKDFFGKELYDLNKGVIKKYIIIK